MANPELGEAVIVYEDPEEGTTERTVQNERIAYFQDHWILKFDEDDAGNDVVRRIPRENVHYVDRSVEKFEQEVQTLRNQVESFADDLRSTLFGDERKSGESGESEPLRIDVESEDENR